MNWQQVCEHPSLQDLPFKIELDGLGKIIMSPTRVFHGIYQAEIGHLLRSLRPEGQTVTECAVQTTLGTKVADVAWASAERAAEIGDVFDCSVAPEICVEILSPGNTHEEMMAKKRAYFAAGAQEFWLCDEEGEMSFYLPSRKVRKSRLVPEFPERIEP